MRSVGFIGYGSMGSMLLEGFLATGGIAPADAVVSTRTPVKLGCLRERWPAVAMAACNAGAARARHVFLCVKPMDIKPVLDEILPALAPDTHLISIAGAVPIASIEGLTGCAVTKLIPTVTAEVHGGVSLVCHGETVTPEDAAFVEELLGGIGGVKRLPEAELALATELTSCMPGFIASIFQEMTESALRHSGQLSQADAEELVLQTLLGTARLLAERGMGLDEAIAHVATPGGTTAEGVRVFRARLPEVFDEMFDRTLAKRAATVARAEAQFLEGADHAE